jgi:hypothetical protein
VATSTTVTTADRRTRSRYHARDLGCPGGHGATEIGSDLGYRYDVNAVAHFATLVPSDAVRRLAALRVMRFDAHHSSATRALDVDAARGHVVGRWGDDLCGFLNALTRGELTWLADQLGVRAADTRAPNLREQLWRRGAALERGGEAELPTSLQPRPVLLGGHLVIQAAPRGMYPPSEVYPRGIPGEGGALPPDEEPDSVDELLAAADRAVGVRLGARGRDKGAWGLRAAALLGVLERGGDEPDWRGDVEIKTVPVAREASGLWRVVEDPAIAMVHEGGALAKLQRTLWLARTDLPEGDATIVSWYLLDWDPTVARLARRYLHQRPKGPAGTDQRGWYLSKRFFADAGLLATLNGNP